MKRFFQFCGFLLLAAVIYAGGAYSLPLDETTAAPPPEELYPVKPPDDERDQDEPVHAIIEYGRSELINHNNDPLHVYIRYPQANNPADAVISEWASGIYNDMSAEFYARQEYDQGALGEINVQFDSYLIDNRYTGILETGELSYSMSEPSEEIIKTFNIDLSNFELLEAPDIFDFEESESLLTLLTYRLLVEHPDTDGYLNYMDESWLNNVVIGHDGIVVVLPQNEFLPEMFTTMMVTLPYEDLGSLLLIRTEPPLTEIPASPEDTYEDPYWTPPEEPGEEPAEEPGEEPAEEPGEEPAEEPGEEPAEEPGEEPAEEPALPEEDVEPAMPGEGEYQIPEVPPQSPDIDPSLPMIALSFDDGPGVYTMQFLDLFEQYGVRVTFCSVGNLVNTQRDALIRAVDIGCEVIGHSWDHKNLAKLTEDDVRKQLLDTSNTIKAATGVATPMFRPPYGATSDTMKSVAEELGFAIINWNVDPGDWNIMDADAIYNAVMQQAEDRSIVISHEIYGSTLEAYTRLIPELILQGYQIVTVSELLKYTHGELTPGQVYYYG